MNDIVYEEQKQLIKMWKDKYDEKKEETKILHSIIKEVRELLKSDYFEDGSFNNYEKVFELLDKVEEK